MNKLVLDEMLTEAEDFDESLVESKLKEEDEEDDMTLADKVVDKANAVLGDDSVITTDGQIEQKLDALLRKNKNKLKRGDHDFQNVLFVGPAGTGKTSRIIAWAQSRGVNLVSALAATMDDTDLGGAVMGSVDTKVVYRLSSTEFDELDEIPNSVLFLDEFNRAVPSVRATLLTLIQDHTIPDARVKGKKRFLKNFLFTVAAVNPSDENYNTIEMDKAELGRFAKVDVIHDRLNTRDYLDKQYARAISLEDDPEELAELKRQAVLGHFILSSNKFNFDTPEDAQKSKNVDKDGVPIGNGLETTARNFTNCLQQSDGTKEDFMKHWNEHCNSLKLPMIRDILNGYVDKDDKANDALKNYKDGEKKSAFAEPEEDEGSKTARTLFQAAGMDDEIDW